MRQEMITDITADKFVLTPGGTASDIERIWGVASDYDDFYHPMTAIVGFLAAQCKHKYATMAVDLLPRLGLQAIEYKTALDFALQAAQTIGMDGNDPDLTEGPDGHPFPTNLETAARDEAIRAARLCSQDHVLQDKLQQKEAKAAEKRKLIAVCEQEQAAKEANKKEQVAEKLRMIAECQQEQAAKAANKKRKAAEKQAKAKEPEKKWKAGGAGGGAAGRGGTGWACMTCTFVNSTSARCRCGMCGQ
jgi:hypothetical protein